MHVVEFDKEKHRSMIHSWWMQLWGVRHYMAAKPAEYYLNRGRVLYDGETPVFMVFLVIDDATKYAYADLLTRNPTVEMTNSDKYGYVSALVEHVLAELTERFGGEGVFVLTPIDAMKAQQKLLVASGFEHDPTEPVYRYRIGR